MEQANESLRQWYLNYIDYFRKEYKKLSPNDKQSMSKTNNFLNPCQIEVFWVTNPDYQLIIQSNFDDRPDREVIINGPYKLDEFHSNAAAVLKEERWSRSLAQDRSMYERIDTLGEQMAAAIFDFTETIKSHFFQSPQRGNHKLNGRKIDDVWVQGHMGNIGNLNYAQEIDKTIQYIRKNAKTRQEPFVRQPGSFGTNTATGFGIHFFPPITMRKKRKPTIEQLIREGLHVRLGTKNVLDMKIDGHQVVVNDDGFVFVEAGKERALEILNLIMACGIFYDHKFYVVRERELITVKYDKPTLTLAFTTMEYWGMRALHFSHLNRQDIYTLKTVVSPETIQKILLKTEKILADKELAAELRLLNECLTHFMNSEFGPSFIMGWTMIEKYFSKLWKNFLNEKEVTGRRLNKLTQTTRWSIDSVLESLSLQSKIDSDSYKDLIKLKDKRNKFYHEGKLITKNDAALCLNYAEKLIGSKS